MAPMGRTPVQILKLWEHARGRRLSAEKRVEFQGRPEIGELCQLDSVAVTRAFREQARLDVALPLARRYSLEVTTQTKPARGKSPQDNPHRNRITDDGPGPTGFYGGLGRYSQRAPIFDPFPDRMCPLMRPGCGGGFVFRKG
jgi:hypothetical protein